LLHPDDYFLYYEEGDEEDSSVYKPDSQESNEEELVLTVNQRAGEVARCIKESLEVFNGNNATQCIIQARKCMLELDERKHFKSKRETTEDSYRKQSKKYERRVNEGRKYCKGCFKRGPKLIGKGFQNADVDGDKLYKTFKAIGRCKPHLARTNIKK
jgi:hypothetical protein